MRACVRACMCMRVYACVYACVPKFGYVCTRVRRCVPVGLRVLNTCICLCACVRVCMLAFMYVMCMRASERVTAVLSMTISYKLTYDE